MTDERFYSYQYGGNKQAIAARTKRANELKQRGIKSSRSSLRNQVIKPAPGESHFTNVYYLHY